jgi:hypothetical protein
MAGGHRGHHERKRPTPTRAAAGGAARGRPAQGRILGVLSHELRALWRPSHSLYMLPAAGSTAWPRAASVIDRHSAQLSKPWRPAGRDPDRPREDRCTDAARLAELLRGRARTTARSPPPRAPPGAVGTRRPVWVEGDPARLAQVAETCSKRDAVHAPGGRVRVLVASDDSGRAVLESRTPGWASTPRRCAPSSSRSPGRRSLARSRAAWASGGAGQGLWGCTGERSGPTATAGPGGELHRHAAAGDREAARVEQQAPPPSPSAAPGAVQLRCCWWRQRTPRQPARDLDSSGTGGGGLRRARRAGEAGRSCRSGACDIGCRASRLRVARGCGETPRSPRSSCRPSPATAAEDQRRALEAGFDRHLAKPPTSRPSGASSRSQRR